jgi:ADP-ribose pyrophosphatase YjhB (NUDIX family)
MAHDGAGVVILLVDGGGNRFVLTGKESSYVRDNHPVVDLNEGAGPQSLRDVLEHGVADKAASRALFKRRAELIQAQLGFTVQFAQPTMDNALGIYTTSYRRLGQNFKYGIPKGRREGGETALANATRELEEETGINAHLNDGHRQPDVAGPGGSVYAIFMKRATEQDAIMILNRVGQRANERYGELFELKFRPIAAILANTNFVTRNALNQIPAVLPVVPGGKRRRTRKLRKHAKKTLRRKSRA